MDQKKPEREYIAVNADDGSTKMEIREGDAVLKTINVRIHDEDTVRRVKEAHQRIEKKRELEAINAG